jgi:hypothetical protein
MQAFVTKRLTGKVGHLVDNSGYCAKGKIDAKRKRHVHVNSSAGTMNRELRRKRLLTPSVAHPPGLLSQILRLNRAAVQGSGDQGRGKT